MFVLNLFLKPLLECESLDFDSYEKAEDDEVYYEEPDLSGGVEGVDYGIVYSAEEDGNEAEE
jgi:hypothetical protein